MIWSVSRSISKWRDNIETYGLDIVNSAYKRNGSAMIVMGHFANWEQMLAIRYVSFWIQE
jgi:lauroyl/myristoyl acyltransferase